ncbi:MAG: hypothetical protein QF521_01065 [Alphaproteobacteria bacterium]|nr:hypothetical protein [Alphaproteobacteria bacterium]
MPDQSDQDQGTTSPVVARRRGLLWFLKNAGDLRDALLVLAGTIYILGYATWSLSAYFLDLGLLPALEAQYFLAGILPAVILGAALLLLVNLSSVDAILRKVFGPNSEVLWGTFHYLAWATLVAFVIAALLDMFDVPDLLHGFGMVPEAAEEWVQIALGVLGFAVFFVAPYLNPDYASKKLSFWRGIWQHWRLTYIGVFIGVFGLAAYGTYFTKLPQEFGGIAKRCAFIDLQADQLSPDSLKTLADTKGPMGEQVVRSQKVHLIFKADSLLVIETAEGQRVELSPDIVRAITWC